jgi:superfamily I DNA/RNA helicase
MNYKVIGPPGTGKTQTLLDKVIEYKNAGTPLERIGYFAFTRKAAYEARDRFLETFPDLSKGTQNILMITKVAMDLLITMT